MHPAFSPYARWIDALGGLDRVPSIALLNRVAQQSSLAHAGGRSLRFEAAPARRSSALQYERRIACDGVIEFRDGNWHDFANALAWLAFPQTKSALNAVHVRDGRDATANGRTRARDAATLVDEAGMIFVCADRELVALLRAWQWRTLFWERRAAVAACVTPLVVGHGLLDRLRAPFRALTAQAVIVGATSEDVDAAAAARISEDDFAPHRLQPLPVAALPGWDAESAGERLFDDRDVFRVKH
jgi:hypothetical protein